MKLWVDDIREAPSGWVWVTEYNEAIKQIFSGKYQIVSLDHDLGDANAKTGYDILCEVERQVAKGGVWITLPEFKIHSANPVGRANMEKAISSIINLQNQ